MPAGDSCTYNEECFTRSCNTTGTTKTCKGLPEGTKCLDDRECFPGLYCAKTTTCTPVAKKTQACDANTRCEFGSHCANKVCTAFGKLKDGSYYYLMDSVKWPSPKDITTEMFRVCENFYAYATTQIAEKIYPVLLCGKGPDANFTNYERKVNDEAECTYLSNIPEGTKVNFTAFAKCGYNHNGHHYCPKVRGYKDYEFWNDVDRGLWNATVPVCHHRSTIQYCREIEDNPLISLAYRQFMLREWETSGDNYALIADSQRCSGEAITLTKSYYRMKDSAMGTVMTYFALVVGFMGLAYLY